MNKKLIILSIVGLVLIGIIAGRSFSYFSTANSEGVENVVESGTMALLFTDGPQITADKLAPGEYIEKTFKVKNTGNVDTRYDVYFSEVINTFVDQSDLVYTLASNDGGYNTTSEVVVPNEASKMVNQYLISPNEEHTYTLRITFKLKETIQNVNMGRTFTAKININEFNLNSGEHFLKLIDANGEEVDKQILATNKENYTLALNNTDLTNSTNIYCNNGGIPTINGNTLNVSGITNDTVCTISNNIVDTINNKLTTTKTGIVMTNNQSDVATMTIPSSKEVVFDLNGKRIESMGIDEIVDEYKAAHMVFNINGIMTFNDSIGTGGAYTGTTNRVINVNTNSNITINGGHYNGRQSMYVNGTNSHIEINGGEFNSKLYQPIVYYCSDCDMIINDGVFTFDHSTTSMAIQNVYGGNITINNGVFNSTGIALLNTLGTIIVNGGTYNSTGVTVSNKDGSIEINDGNFNSNSYTIFNQNDGNITINNGDFSSDRLDTVRNDTNGRININGGRFVCNTASNTISNSNSGIINITDARNPVYIANLFVVDSTNASWPKAVINSRNGTINISGDIADNCNETIGINTKGICIFSHSRAVVNEVYGSGPIYIKGTYIKSDSQYSGAVANYDSLLNIKDSLIVSERFNKAMYLSYNSSSQNLATATINICNTRISSTGYDFTNEAAGTIKYSDNNTFVNGTNIPNYANNSTGSVIATNEACNWTMPTN